MSTPEETRAANREGALLTWVQQFAPYGIITLDESFRVQTWNHWMEVHSSMQSADVVGRDFFTIFPDLTERKLTSYFERALKGEPSVLSTALHRYLTPLPSLFGEKSTAKMLQTARIAPLFSDDKICGVVIVIEDVTQRETQAMTLGSQHRRDEILSWSLTHLLKTDEPRNSVRQLFFKIVEHLDFDTFLLYLRDVETSALSLYTGGGVPVDVEKEFAQCPFLAVLPAENKDVIVLNSVQQRPEACYSFLKQVGVCAAIILPLFIEDRNLGLLCFMTASRDSIALEEAALLTTIAQCLAISLDRENTSQQLKRAREQLRSHAQILEKTVQERTAQLQSNIVELETFSYAVAHDLREPVRGLIGYCEVLMEDFSDLLPEEAKFVVQRLARNSRRMESLTRDLLAFSSVSRQQVVFTKVEIEPIIESVLALRAPSVRQSVTVKTPLAAVLGHQALLQHVFSNLIDNAIKFVPPDTFPKITIWTEAIRQPLTPDASKLIRIWVSDDGIGIAPELHSKIFGIFERGLTSDTYEGTGMGLAIVARAMQRMGGTCGVESEPAKGSRFWLELPQA